MAKLPSIARIPQTAHESKPFRFFLIAGLTILGLVIFIHFFSKKAPGSSASSTAGGDLFLTENVYNPPGNAAGGVPAPAPVPGSGSSGSSGGSSSGSSGSSGGSHSSGGSGGSSGSSGSSGGSHSSGGSGGHPKLPPVHMRPPVSKAPANHPIHHTHMNTGRIERKPANEHSILQRKEPAVSGRSLFGRKESTPGGRALFG